jgi:hypothetical protein
LTDDLDDGQVQLNMDVYRGRMNRGGVNLARNVFNQSKISWALGTSIPLKSAGTYEIVLALLQQGMKHLVPYLCCIFRICLTLIYSET